MSGQGNTGRQENAALPGSGSIRCVIVDDEYLAIRILEEYSARIPALTVLKSFKDPREASLFLHDNKVDLLFLDIQMPRISGIELAGKLSLPGAGPLIVFTTARHEFAVKAFELDALDYLVKPISFERFEKTIRKAEEYLRSFDNLPLPGAPAAGASIPDTIPLPQEFLLIKSDHRTIRLLYEEISVIEGLNEYVKVHTSGKKIITLAALKDLEATLPRDKFVRIHRSYIISLGHIRSWNASEVEMDNGLRLPVGRVYKENFLQQVRP